MIQDLLQRLPQRDQIDQDDAQRWMDGIMRWQRERAAWHVKRLMGFGGSEIGAVVRGVTESSASGFSSLDEIIKQKLMMRLPLRQTEPMRRGTVLEELAQLAFMYRYKAATDIQAMEALRNGKTRPGYEWLVGNPDDLNIIGGKRYLNDYKVPSTFSDEIDFDYDCQLHHYGLIGRMAGVKIDGYLLTKLDLAPELAASLTEKFPTMTEAEKHSLAKTIAATDVPGMRVVAMGVEHKRSLDIEILDTGRFAWENYVMQGVVPDMRKAVTTVLQEDQRLDLANLQQQFAMAKAGIAHLDEIASVATAKMTAMLKDVDLANEALPINIVNVSHKNHDKQKLVEEAIAEGATEDDLAPDNPTYDVAALVEEIKRLNGDPNAAHLMDRTPSPAKAKDYLQQIEGYSLDDLRTPGINVSVSRKKADKQSQAMLTGEAATLLTPWFEKHALGNDPEDQWASPDSLESWGTEVASGMLLESQSEVDDETQPKPPRIGAGMR